MASAYGWTPRVVERELTDELLILYLDEAVDRRTKDNEARFDSMVEATRIGTVFAHDKKQYDRWRRASRKRRPRGLKGEALERVMAAFAVQNPDLVAFGPKA